MPLVRKSQVEEVAAVTAVDKFIIPLIDSTRTFVS